MSPRKVVCFGPDDRLTLYPISGASPETIGGVEPVLVRGQVEPGGGFLYLLENEESYTNIYRVEPCTGQLELWKTLIPADATGFEEVYVHIAAAGQSCYSTIPRALSDLFLVRGLRRSRRRTCHSSARNVEKKASSRCPTPVARIHAESCGIRSIEQR